MSAKFEDLIVQHQSAERIPDDILFHWVSQATHLGVDGQHPQAWKSTAKRSVFAGWLSRLSDKKSAAERSLICSFLTRYFLWGTMPFGAGKDMVRQPDWGDPQVDVQSLREEGLHQKDRPAGLAQRAHAALATWRNEIHDRRL
jgi:hypothetical protein